MGHSMINCPHPQSAAERTRPRRDGDGPAGGVTVSAREVSQLSDIDFLVQHIDLQDQGLAALTQGLALLTNMVQGELASGAIGSTPVAPLATITSVGLPWL